MNRIDQDLAILKANQQSLTEYNAAYEYRQSLQNQRNENVKIYAVYAYDRAVRRGRPKSLRSCWEFANTSADPHCQWWSTPAEEIKELTYQLSSTAGMSQQARERHAWIKRCIEQHSTEPTQFTAYAINARAEKLEQFRTLMDAGY